MPPLSATSELVSALCHRMNTSSVGARARKLKSSVSAPIRRVAVESLSNGQSIGLNPRFLSRPSLSTHLSPTDRPSDYWICPIPLIIPNPAAAVVERNALGPRQERCNQYGSLETLRQDPHTCFLCSQFPFILPPYTIYKKNCNSYRLGPPDKSVSNKTYLVQSEPQREMKQSSHDF